MTIVKIPFQSDMKLEMLNGTKTATSRPSKMGEIGDYFVVGGAGFQLTNVSKKPLGEICLNHYKEEGCKSSQHFIDVWSRIHYNKGFIPTWVVFFHEFRRVG